MMKLFPLVVATYGTGRQKGGRKFQGFTDKNAVISVCESLFRQVAGAGFDVAALCQMFMIEEKEVPSLMAENGLNGPGIRKLRFLSRPTSWTPLQVQHLLIFWHCQITIDVIADLIGRSPGSVRYKARSLGLQTRPRQTLVREPPHQFPPLASIQHRDWNYADRLRLGEEHLRGIDTCATAWRLRRDYRHTQCELFRIELPGRSMYRKQLTKTIYDPADPMLPKFRKEGWNFRKCIMTGSDFWSEKNGPRICAEFKRTKAYRDMVASGVLAYE